MDGPPQINTSMAIYAGPDEYAHLQVNFGTSGITGVEDSYAGHLMSYLRDFTSCSLEVFEGRAAREQMRNFDVSTIDAPPQIGVITVDVPRAQLAIPHSIIQMYKKNKDGRMITEQLQLLREVMESARKKSTEEGDPVETVLEAMESTEAARSTQAIHLKMLIRLSTDQEREDLEQLVESINKRSEDDHADDPLKKYFTASPKVRQLTLDHCMMPLDESFPKRNSGTRVVHFASSAHHIVHTVLGSLYDIWLELKAVDTVQYETFIGFVLPLKHVAKDRRFLLLIDPEGQDTILPRSGETCKINFAGVRLHQLPAKVVDKREILAAGHDLATAFKEMKRDATPSRPSIGSFRTYYRGR